MTWDCCMELAFQFQREMYSGETRGKKIKAFRLYILRPRLNPKSPSAFGLALCVYYTEFIKLHV